MRAGKQRKKGGSYNSRSKLISNSRSHSASNHRYLIYDLSFPPPTTPACCNYPTTYRNSPPTPFAASTRLNFHISMACGFTTGEHPYISLCYRKVKATL
uniref:Uncharacterized protein n=1 Tax=Ciona savignyi TaxID=51511 RepID=H2Z2L3_CIOSA